MNLIKVLMLISVPLLAHAELSAKQVLDKVYGGYEKKHDCWLAIVDGQRYCMKIDHTDKIASDTGQRLYLLMAGDAVDEQGEPNGGHVTSGLIGAFVFEEHEGKARIVASDAKISMGANGFAPSKWQLVKLAPSDYWGWKNSVGDCHQGYCGSWYAILAPYGKKIRDLAGFVGEFDDEGVCGDEEQKCKTTTTAIQSTLEIDDSQINEKVYPLHVTVTGKEKGKELTAKTWNISFDTQKWSYMAPKDWPLKDRDF